MSAMSSCNNVYNNFRLSYYNSGTLKILDLYLNDFYRYPWDNIFPYSVATRVQFIYIIANESKVTISMETIE